MISNSSAGCPQPRTDNEQSPHKIFNRLFVRVYARLGTACATISRLGTACATISRLGTACATISRLRTACATISRLGTACATIPNPRSL